MKKNWKTLISVGLCAFLTAGLMTGCGGNGKTASNQVTGNAGTEASSATEAVAATDTKDMPVVNFVMPSFYDFSDAPTVETALNKVLAQKYGIQAKLTYISIGAWVQQTNLLMTGDDADVIAVFITPLSSYVANGQLLSLDDYFNKSSDSMKNTFSDGQMKSTRVNGKLYSLSNFKDFAGSIDYLMDEEIVKEMNIDTSSIKSLDDIEGVLAKVKEAHPDLYPMVPQHDSQMLSSGWTWDSLGVGFANAFTAAGNYGQSTKVECTYDLDDFKTFTNTMYKWYDKGYIMADALSNTEAGDALVQGGKAFSCFVNGSVNKLPAGTVAARIVEPWSTSSAYTGVTYGINSNSKNPDAAWKLLEAMYTDSEVETILLDGVEGTHYINNTDGTISYPQGIDDTTTKYGGASQAWLYPNATLTKPINTLGTSDYFKQLMDFNNNAKNSKALGFMFDTSKCADAYSACLNIHKKYFNALLCGAVDPSTVIPQAVEEMKAAGLETVMKEEQTQLDAFLAQ